MRKELYVGLSLSAAGLVLVLIGGWLDLELASVTLLGLTAGAIVAIVPDRTPAFRLAGFAAGVVISWIGFFIRAALMPDTETGRAVYVGVVLLLAMAAALVAFARLPLWSVLLGVGTFAGAFEETYNAAPPLVAGNSVSTATTLLLTTAVGFMAAAWVAPEREPSGRTDADATDEPTRTREGDEDTVALDSMMDRNR